MANFEGGGDTSVTAIIGDVTADQGDPNTLANGWPFYITDLITGPVHVTPASTSPTATDKALVVAISPNSAVNIDIGKVDQGLAGVTPWLVTDANLDVALSTRASEATQLLVKADLDEIALDTDNLDVALSTRASQATQLSVLADLDEIKLDTDSLANLDVALSTRNAEATQLLVKADLDEIALDTDNLDVALSTRNAEATQLLVKADLDEIALDTDNLDVALSTRTAAAQLPAALVGGRLDENLGAWLGSTAPTVGTKVAASSIPVTMASDQPVISVSSKTALSASAPTSVSVGVASGAAVASNASRKGLVLVNTSTANISFGIGATAVLNSGITLTPNGTWVMDEFTFTTGAINAIAAIAGSNLAVQEFA